VRPDFTVGNQARPELGEALLGLSVVETTAGLSRCEATFSNWGTVQAQPGFRFFDWKVIDFGVPFRVDLDETIFEGRVTAVEAGFAEGSLPTIGVVAEDRLQALRATRRTRTFTSMTDAELIQRIAADHGLAPAIDVTGPTHAVLAQLNQSDLEFLRERARALDAEIWVRGTSLHAQARSRRNAGTISLTFPGELSEFWVIADLASQRTSVIVGGWDVAEKSAIQQEATDAALAAEIGQRVTGARILTETFGTFNGLGPVFSGAYYVTETRHVFDGAKGFRTEFTAESIGIAGRTRRRPPSRTPARPAPAVRPRTAPARTPKSARSRGARRTRRRR